MSLDEIACDRRLRRVERMDLTVNELTHGAILQAFDVARRQLAVSCFGAEGAAVGFVDLELLAPPAVEGEELLIEARELERGPRWQRVEYLASLRAAPFPRAKAGAAQPSAEGIPVARAIGQTVGFGDPR